MTPIFKEGDKTKPKDYRPITLTSNIKLFERIVFDRVVKYLNLMEQKSTWIRKRKILRITTPSSSPENCRWARKQLYD